MQQPYGTLVCKDLPDHSMGIDTRCSAEVLETTSNKQASIFFGRAHQVTSPNQNIATIDFWPGTPDHSAFPIRQWRRILTDLLSVASPQLTTYGDPAGHPLLREAIASHLGPSRGIRVNSQRIIVVTGTQMALNIVCRLLVGVGSKVIVEDPCYEGASNVFESYGGQLLAIPVDSQGLCAEELPKEGASVVYVTPSHQFPLGHTMSVDRRRQLIEWSNKTGAYLVEDDYDADFKFAGPPLPALASMDNEQSVFYLGTFSKALGPGLRIGFIIPPSHLYGPALAVKTLFDHYFPWFEQAALAEFLESGEYVSHLRRIRHMYAARLATLREAINIYFTNVEIAGDQGGMHVTWMLPRKGLPAASIAELALKRGVGIYPVGTSFCRIFKQTDEFRRTLVMGYAAVRERYIREGIVRIAECISELNAHPRSLDS